MGLTFATLRFSLPTMANRGVRLELDDGSSLLLAAETDPAALADPTYNRDHLSIDASAQSTVKVLLAVR